MIPAALYGKLPEQLESLGFSEVQQRRWNVSKVTGWLYFLFPSWWPECHIWRSDASHSHPRPRSDWLRLGSIFASIPHYLHVTPKEKSIIENNMRSTHFVARRAYRDPGHYKLHQIRQQNKRLLWPEHHWIRSSLGPTWMVSQCVIHLKHFSTCYNGCVIIVAIVLWVIQHLRYTSMWSPQQAQDRAKYKIDTLH